jgi:hypothetical protein
VHRITALNYINTLPTHKFSALTVGTSAAE